MYTVRSDDSSDVYSIVDEGATCFERLLCEFGQFGQSATT
jgi:hypothetical protein